MSDPLSVTAGVLGILGVSAQLIQTLYQLGSNIKDARKDADAVAKEVSGISIIIQSLQTYVFGRQKASPQRLQLITLEQIIATVTECVFTYDELGETLKSLHVDSGMKVWDRAIWVLKKDKVGNLNLRLQSHKATFSTMLNILQWRVTPLQRMNIADTISVPLWRKQSAAWIGSAILSTKSCALIRSFHFDCGTLRISIDRS